MFVIPIIESDLLLPRQLNQGHNVCEGGVGAGECLPSSQCVGIVYANQCLSDPSDYTARPDLTCLSCSYPILTLVLMIHSYSAASSAAAPSPKEQATAAMPRTRLAMAAHTSLAQRILGPAPARITSNAA